MSYHAISLVPNAEVTVIEQLGEGTNGKVRLTCANREDLQRIHKVLVQNLPPCATYVLTTEGNLSGRSMVAIIKDGYSPSKVTDLYKYLKDLTDEKPSWAYIFNLVMAMGKNAPPVLLEALTFNGAMGLSAISIGGPGMEPTPLTEYLVAGPRPVETPGAAEAGAGAGAVAGAETPANNVATAGPGPGNRAPEKEEEK